MRAQLRLRPHNFSAGDMIIEVWHNGVFLATITGTDGPGVRVISKYIRNTSDAITIEVVEPTTINISLDPKQ